MQQTVINGNGFYLHHTLTPRPDPKDFLSHAHNMAELYYFVAGDADFAVEGHTFPLKKGTLIYTTCGQTHNLLLRSEQSYERIALLFDPYLLPAVSLKEECHVFSLSEREQVFFEEALSPLSAAGEDAEPDLVKAVLAVIFAKLALLASDTPPMQNGLIARVVQYINTHLTGDLSLDTVAHQFFRDKSYLNRRFKAVMGCCIGEYVIRKRIFTAREQLLLTKNIKGAVALSGFGEYTSFYRAYKRLIGRSPSEDLRQSESSTASKIPLR